MSTGHDDTSSAEAPAATPAAAPALRIVTVGLSEQQLASMRDAVRELSSLVAGICPGRGSDRQITLFKSNGIAAWDLAAAATVYRLAKECGLGRTLPFWQTS